MSTKKKSKIKKEIQDLTKIYEMGVESLDPESFEQLENIIEILKTNRNLKP